MPAAETERLRQLQADLSRTLETQITELMAHIKASQDVAHRIIEAESEIRSRTAARTHFSATVRRTRSLFSQAAFEAPRHP